MTKLTHKGRKCLRSRLRGNIPLVDRVGNVFTNGLLVLCSWSLLVVPVSVEAQTASLEGRVTDEQDAVIVGVVVTVDTSFLTQPVITITDATGNYQVNELFDGVYTVTFEIQGFKTVRYEEIRLFAGVKQVLSVEMEVTPLLLQLDVVGVAPLLGSGISPDLVPTTTITMNARELERLNAPSLAAALNERVGSVSLEDATGNLFQPTLRFRGFTASPLLGLPQGIAVYQNGVRINEPFGDTVQFDLIPHFALQRVQLSSGVEPVFGLNALGGALALQLKSGFDTSGFRGEFGGGSFGRVTGTVEVGESSGPWAIYMGATRFHEMGWRQASESNVTQAVADLSYRKGRFDTGINFVYADTILNGNGATPIELLEVDRKAVFTSPDTTENRLGFIQSRMNYILSRTWSVQAIGYYRGLDRETLNGDEAEFEPCNVYVLPTVAPAGTLCYQPHSSSADEVGLGAKPLVDLLSGRFITQIDARGDGVFNRTTTHTEGYGSTFQAMATTELVGRNNAMILGVSADVAKVTFGSNSEIGTLTTERAIDGSGLYLGTFGNAPDDEFNTSLDSRNRTYGLYFSNTLSLTKRINVTAAGRYNRIRRNIRDQLGTALTGDHVFARFNPSLGSVYTLSDRVSVFGRYSESNRAPTAAELSCANPAEPCRVPNAFVSDPPLHQAVARSVEVGVRGQFFTDSVSNIRWLIAGYRIRVDDDILFVSSPELAGTGFFQNAGDTQRAGLDLSLTGDLKHVGWYTSYGLVQATFASPLVLPSDPDVNDAASENGELDIQVGDRLPGIPRHSFKSGLMFKLTDVWDMSLETIATSSRVFNGDEGNDQLVLDGHGIVNLRSAYRINEHVEVFTRANNLFDQKYGTFGVLAELELELKEAPNATDSRFVSPGTPRNVFAGFRVRFW